jgi:hypothetical protein
VKSPRFSWRRETLHIIRRAKQIKFLDDFKTRELIPAIAVEQPISPSTEANLQSEHGSVREWLLTRMPNKKRTKALLQSDVAIPHLEEFSTLRLRENAMAIPEMNRNNGKTRS